MAKSKSSRKASNSKGKSHSGEFWKRSVVKAITYRIIIIILDFSVIYLLTGKIELALGFMVVSNIYTTIAYFLHERLWAKVKWGTPAYMKRSA